MSDLRQDFLLQNYNGVYDFPLDDFYINGVIQPTPYGNSDDQHILDIIVNNTGAIKQFPLLGFGLFKWLNSEATSDKIYQSLRNNMKSDLYLVQVGAINMISNDGFVINYNKIIPNY